MVMIQGIRTAMIRQLLLDHFRDKTIRPALHSLTNYFTLFIDHWTFRHNCLNQVGQLEPYQF